MYSLKVLAVMAVLMGMFVFAGNAAADRIVNNGDGTVTDTQYGLMWADHDNGSDIKWYNAKRYCEGYSGGGKSGWRMPTTDELHHLWESGACKSVITITGNSLWAAETDGSDASSYQFGSGIRHWKAQSFDFFMRALPVRSGR
jgi:hypothetical protein